MAREKLSYGEKRMILETKRLVLRPWQETDAEELYRYAKDPRVGPAAGWKAHESVEESKIIIRDILSANETYAIVWKETGLPIGSIGLHHNDLAAGEDELELGFWLGVPFWGRGLVPEAAREILRHAFLDLGVKRVWCRYYDGNEKSKRVQEKLGFRYQFTSEVPVPALGETRKGHANLLTKEEWEEGLKANLTFSVGEEKFNYRVGGILLNGNKILTIRDEVAPHSYLPGGRVKIGERAEDALLREIKEELGIIPRIVRPLWLNQAFFTEDETKGRYHELCFYFLLDASETDLMERGERFVRSERHHTLTFEWISFERLKEEYFYPIFLKTEIFSLPKEFTLRTEIEE